MRELSRLSRTDKDWCHLLELCGIFDTLVGDHEHLYDVNVLDDQLVLGIKGTLSVVELKVLKQRLLAGMEAKAQRGALIRMLAPGYVTDGQGQIVKDPNIRVQEAIALIFQTLPADVERPADVQVVSRPGHRAAREPRAGRAASSWSSSSPR